MARKEGTTKSSLPAFQRNLQQTIAGIADPTRYIQESGRFRSYVVLCTRNIPDQHHKNFGYNLRRVGLVGGRALKSLLNTKQNGGQEGRGRW